ncbi:MAG: hypothetical protein Q7T82_04585 [Armatimonadota bacterium]|nr:hypothetical protein [Armatimonadota bacterium]
MRQPIRVRESWLVAAGIALLSLGSAFASAGQQFTFTFNPPEGASCVMTVKTTRAIAGGPDGKHTDVGETKERIEISKTPTGYAVAHTPLSLTMTRDGKPFSKSDMALAGYFVNLSMVRDLDAKGECVGIRNPEEIARQLADAFGRNAPASVQQSVLMIAEGLIAKNITEWNGRIADFVGRKAKVGDVWATTSEAGSPLSGSMPMPTKIKFVGMMKYRRKDCVRISYRNSAGSGSMQQYLQDIMDRTSASSGNPRSRVLRVQVAAQGERLIDPATMLIYTESLTRTFNVTTQTPGQKNTTVSSVEKRQDRYDYSQ